MEGLDGATDEQVAAFAEHVARLKHDLGKYIAFRQNWLADEADEDALRQALVADLHHTRRGPAGSVDAQTVWREFRPPLLGEVALAGFRLSSLDARVEVVEAAMEALAVLEPLEEADGPTLRRAGGLAREVATEIRELARSSREMVLARRTA